MAYTPKLNNLFKSFVIGGGDQTDNIANQGQQWIDFYHVPTGKSVKFKAMITAFSDQYTSNWNAEDVYGRMDPIATFQKTGRVINFSFDVVASSEANAATNLRRIESLIQMLYPVYSGNTMKNSPMMEIKFTNLIQNSTDETGLLGFLGGIDYAPNFDVGTYSYFQGGGKGMGLFPKVASLNCQFTVLHEHKLGWANKNPINSNFPYGTPQYYDEEPKEVKKQQANAAGGPTSGQQESRSASGTEPQQDSSGNPNDKRPGEPNTSATKAKNPTGKNKKTVKEKKPKNVFRAVMKEAEETTETDKKTSSEYQELFGKSPMKKGPMTRAAGEPGYKEKTNMSLMEPKSKGWFD